MKPLTVALLGNPTRAAALRQRLRHPSLVWTTDPTPLGLNLLLDTEDSARRQRLLDAQLSFQVVWNDTQALRAIGAALGEPLVDTAPELLQGRGRWSCESCSDPDCEHRLFSALLAQRNGSGA